MTVSGVPLTSIVLPTYNGEKYVRQAIEACLRQTRAELELIVIDDASTDGTAEVLTLFPDPRLRVVRHTVNQGLVASLDHGFREALGEYLTWTSDDNYHDLTALEVMAGILDRVPGVDFVYTAYLMVDEDGRVLRSGRTLPPEALDRDNCVGGCFLYRRRVYEAIGNFDPKAFLVEDYQYWLRVRERFVMKLVPELLYFYRVQGKSLTAKHGPEKVQGQVALVRRAFIPAWKHYFLLAEDRRYARHRFQALGNAAVSLALNPFNRAGWRILALSLLS